MKAATSRNAVSVIRHVAA